jgi:hypothetical protein
MDAATKDVASRAILASRNHIRALVNDPDADLAKPENADDAWDYTPNVDVSAFTAQCAPFLRAQLNQSAKLWALMQDAVKAQSDLDKEKGIPRPGLVFLSGSRPSTAIMSDDRTLRIRADWLAD